MARGNRRGRNPGATNAAARIAANAVPIPAHRGSVKIKAPRTQVPNWRELDAMPTFERALAMELREQIWIPNKTDITILDPTMAPAAANQTPLPKMFLDMNTMPPTMGMVMQDNTRVSQEFGSAYSDRLVRKIEIALNWHRSQAFESRTGSTNNAWRGQVAGPTPQQIARMQEVEAARKAAYQAHVDAEHAVEAAKDAARKQRRDEERAAEAAKGEKPYTVTLPQIPKDKPTGRQRTQQEQYEHNVHVNPDQKGFRSRDFVARGVQAHLDRLAREAKERADAAAKLVSEMDKEDAAAAHIVPPPPTISERFMAALGLS